MRGYTHGELGELPLGTLITSIEGYHSVVLGNHWYIRLMGGIPYETREIWGKMEHCSSAWQKIWDLLCAHVDVRTGSHIVDLDITLPTVLREGMAQNVQEDWGAPFVQRVLAIARTRATFPAVVEAEAEVLNGGGFIRIRIPRETVIPFPQGLVG